MSTDEFAYFFTLMTSGPLPFIALHLPKGGSEIGSDRPIGGESGKLCHKESRPLKGQSLGRWVGRGDL